MTQKVIPYFIGCEEYKEFFFKCVVSDKPGQYTYEGKTPAGGARLLFYFVDSNNTPTEIENAGFVELQEFDDKNQLIHIEHGKSDNYQKWTQE